jgi:hypothetical protein
MIPVNKHDSGCCLTSSLHMSLLYVQVLAATKLFHSHIVLSETSSAPTQPTELRLCYVLTYGPAECDEEVNIHL